MTDLFLWAPSHEDHNPDVFRKRYVNGEKTKNGFPYWHEIYEAVENITPQKLVETLEKIWADNLPVCLSQFGPKSSEHLQDLVCDEGKPLLHTNGSSWRRKGYCLEDTMMSYVVLDFDGDHPLISRASGLSDRVKAAKSLLPLLEDLEAVALFSSSAFFEDTDKPNRMNLHLCVFFDRPYPREMVHQWLTQTKKKNLPVKTVDPALGVKTQPHFVANPIFENTEKLNLPGPRVLHIEGKRFCLGDEDIRANPPPTSRKKKNGGTLLSNNLKEKAQQLLEMAKAGELDGERNNLLYREICYANYYTNGMTDSFLEEIDVPEITTGRDGKHDVYQMDSRAKFFFRKQITGEGFSGFGKNTKIIHHLDLADFDKTTLPREGVLALRSGCESGKTKNVIKYITENFGYDRSVIVSAYKGTLQPLSKDTGHAYYLGESSEEIEDPEEKKEWIRSLNRIAITDKSLSYFFNDYGQFKPFDVVFIDESERVAMNSVDVNSRQIELFNLCAAAILVVLLDADASDDLTFWFANEIADDETDQKMLLRLINTKDWMSEGHRAYFLDREADVYGAVEALLNRNKRVFLHTGFSDQTEERRISAIVRLFQENFPEKSIKGWDAYSVPNAVRRDPHAEIDRIIETEGLDLLIVSPWSKVGWDYNGKHAFDATVGTYPHHFMTAPDIAQQMRRPRKTKLHYVWLGRRPKNGAQKLFQLEDTWDNRPELRKLKRDFASELAERARRKKVREQQNISFHLRMILDDRGCKTYQGWRTQVDEVRVAELLTDYGKEEDDKIIARIMNDPWKKRALLSDFFIFDNYGDGRRALTNADLSKEEIAELHRRKIKVDENHLSQVSEIWFKNPEQREMLDKDDARFFAEIAGELLDAVDEIIRKTVGNPDRFIDWVRHENPKDLYLSFNHEDFEPIKELLQSIPGRYENSLPFIQSEGGLLHNKVKIFEWLAELYDLEYTLLSPKKSEGRKDAKLKTIRAYEGKRFTHEGITKIHIRKSRAKDGAIRQQNKKIEIIEDTIDEKLENREALTQIERFWMTYRRDFYVRLSKPTYRQERVYRAINKACL
nr:hypothetical protein 7 [Paracoccaceae bacterium]